MSNIHIRAATVTDVPIIVMGNEQMAQETEELALDRQTLTRGVRHLIDHPELGQYWIAEIDNQVVGQCMITTEWSDWRNGPMWWFQSVYVTPSARRSGVFSALYRHVEAVAESQGVRRLKLYVERSNDGAKSTYQSLGMRPSHYELLEAVLRPRSRTSHPCKRAGLV